MKTALRIDRLRILREERGWSQREMSIRCGLGESQINKYEAGVHDPSATYLKIMAEQLEVSADYLLGLTDVPSGKRLDVLSPDERHLVIAYSKGDSATVLELLTKQIRQAETENSQ